MSAEEPGRFLPHGPEMVYVHGVVRHDEEGCTCTATFGADNPFARGGRVRSFVTVEMAAQVIAVHEGLLSSQRSDERKEEAQSGRIGYLVAMSDLQLLQPDVDCEEELQVTVTRAASTPGLAVYAMRVARAAGESVATAELKTFRPE